MKVYLAGPVSLGGTLPPAAVAANVAAFKRVAQILRDADHVPLDPTELPTDLGAWSNYMRRTLPMVCDAEGIYLLPGWEESPGARLEAQVAEALGLVVFNASPPKP